MNVPTLAASHDSSPICRRTVGSVPNMASVLIILYCFTIVDYPPTCFTYMYPAYIIRTQFLLAVTPCA